MSLKARITDDMKSAMRARDAKRLAAIRLLLAAIKQREVDERHELADVDVVSTVERMSKQRRDSIAQFEAGGRHDLAEGERFELGLLQGYMPEPLQGAELQDAVAAAIAQSGARGPQEMGKVMALLKVKLAGRADMGQVSALVKSRLAG